MLSLKIPKGETRNRKLKRERQHNNKSIKTTEQKDKQQYVSNILKILVLDYLTH